MNFAQFFKNNVDVTLIILSEKCLQTLFLSEKLFQTITLFFLLLFYSNSTLDDKILLFYSK